MFLKPLLAKNQVINYNFVPLQKTSLIISVYLCSSMHKTVFPCMAAVEFAYSSNRLSERPSLKLLNLRKKNIHNVHVCTLPRKV